MGCVDADEVILASHTHTIVFLHFEYRLIATAIFLFILMEVIDACHGDAVVGPICSFSIERNIYSLPLVCAEIVAGVLNLGCSKVDRAVIGCVISNCDSLLSSSK